ncbi:unnamed protein product [Heligmosomoides polygyrus]|uniref:MFS domain-containing protein n=1 Tax=Heligmosomoides polygyrus TaxID=6339 RepID=A0A183GKU9_HELPZ|nr:unnamed protein product [Heligmosomoides polygyrus]
MTEQSKRLDDYVVMSRYVVFVCILAELLILPQVSSMFYMMFAGASPSLSSCDGGPLFDTSLEEREVCTLYAEIGPANCTVPLLRYQFLSVNVEWSRFCESAKTIKNSISVQMIGVLIGSVVFGQLSDSYGRRKMLNQRRSPGRNIGVNVNNILMGGARVFFALVAMVSIGLVIIRHI